MKNKFDVSKYQFVKNKDRSHKNFNVYERKFNSVNIILTEYKNSFSLYWKSDTDKFENSIASRYVCNNQNQLDFLILNGRAGGFFQLKEIIE